jgi:hypothetical protein
MPYEADNGDLVERPAYAALAQSITYETLTAVMSERVEENANHIMGYANIPEELTA